MGGEPTYSISELAEEIRDFLGEAYLSVWVAGEVARVRQSRRGHLYFELIEEGPGDQIVGKLDAVVWRTDYQRLRRQLAASGQEILDGRQMRCRARVDFYPAGGRLQLVVQEVDPLFTLGYIELRRRETLAGLTAAGLVERNRRLPLPEVPLRIGLVTSEGSAAFHDFLATLAESGYGFQVTFVHAAVQGRAAEGEVASALARVGVCDLDCVVLIRGGGSRSDLAAFDSRTIAEAVARCPLPVLTGLGHEIDQSIADQVSHTPLKTPTKVAELLVERVTDADLAVRACAQALSRLAAERLRRAEQVLQRQERVAQVARLRLRAAERSVDDYARSLALVARRRLVETARRPAELVRRLGAAGPRLLERRRREPERLVEHLVSRASGRLREARALVDGTGRLCQELAPERLLERGYSITRDAGGTILKQPAQVRPGDPITSRLAGGILKSRVEEI
ncbi:MAG: exodeoxyribonuclease VII large subunit [bacterium]|nr:exodeoxyribonuclease VII large subunit [bacterium]